MKISKLIKTTIATLCISSIPFVLIASTGNTSKNQIISCVPTLNNTYACNIESKWFPYGWSDQFVNPYFFADSTLYTTFESFGQIQFTYNSSLIKNAIDNQLIYPNQVVELFTLRDVVGAITYDGDNLKVANVNFKMTIDFVDMSVHYIEDHFLTGNFSYMHRNKFSKDLLWFDTYGGIHHDELSLSYIWDDIGFIFNSKGIVIGCNYYSPSIPYHNMYYFNGSTFGNENIIWHK